MTVSATRSSPRCASGSAYGSKAFVIRGPELEIAVNDRDGEDAVLSIEEIDALIEERINV
jgi:hypothetical protein